MNRQREEKVNRKMKERLAEKTRAKGKAKYIPKIKITPQEPAYIFPDFKFVFAGIGMPEEKEYQYPKLPEHILEKAKELDARISYHAVFGREDRSAGWYSYNNSISLPLKGGIKYLEVIALHELGHAATTPRNSMGSFFNPPDITVTYEAQAWKWARDNAPVWTPAMERFSRLCLRTYTEFFGCEELVEEIYPRGVKS